MYTGRGAYAPLRQADDGQTYFTEAKKNTLSMLMEYTSSPVARKIQNLVYGIVDAVILGVAIAYVDTSAAFQM